MSIEYPGLPQYLYTEDFYPFVKSRMKLLEPEGRTLSLVSLDIDNFNYVNDLFGYDAGDLVLRRITEYFSSVLQTDEYFTRIHADHFLFCLKSSSDITVRLTDITAFDGILEGILPAHYRLVTSGGIVQVADNLEALPSILDKANFARKHAKGSTSTTFLHYNKKMSEDIKWQKIVTFTMEKALYNREFEMYLQPKILIKSDQIAGAEALVRWNSPEYGMIYPDKFIPIMEQNGFILQLDFFMLKEACFFLKSNIEQGITPLPISVNFSKMHIQTEHFVAKVFKTVSEVGISASLIEVEFTENLFTDDFEHLVDVVTDLKLLGFKVSLDDFGSAYSSLNCLKDLPIDIVKIDKGFLDSTTDTGKGRLIISKVVELLKSLRMLTVMEGVETGEQVGFLQKLSCDLGQGYFYARPMPASDFISYMKEGSVVADVSNYLSASSQAEDSSYLDTIPLEFQMDNWELYTLGKNIDMGLMKGYLDSEATIQYVNERALEYLGYSRREFREIFHNSIIAFTHPDDVHIVQENTVKLMKTGTPIKFCTRAIRKDGEVIVLQGNASCVKDSTGRTIGLYAFQDITEELQKTEALQKSLRDKINELEKIVVSEKKIQEAFRLSEERYRLILEQSDDIMFEWNFEDDSVQFSDKYKQLFHRTPMCDHVTTNPVMRTRVHPDDLHIFERWVTDTYRKPNYTEATFRYLNAENEYLWMRSRSTAICSSEGVPLRAVGVYSNITAEKTELDYLTLKAQLDPLTKLYNKEETENRINGFINAYPDIPGAFFIIDIDDFKGLNDTLGHQLGDSILMDMSKKIQKIFRKSDIIGRIGGDEFVVYMCDYDDSDSVRVKAELLAQTLRMSYYGSVQKYQISGSIGVSCYPSDGTSFDKLYYTSDVALYEAKKLGKDQYFIYHGELKDFLTENRTPLDINDGFLSSYYSNDLVYKIFNMLYETTDINASMQMILSVLGTQYQVDRAYIFQNDPGGTTISNTYEWNFAGNDSVKDTLQNLPLTKLKSYFDAFSKEGILCCSDISVLDDFSGNIIARQGIQSFLHCRFFCGGKPAGFIGFDIYTEQHAWTGEEIAVLGYISRGVGVFLHRGD